MTQRTLVYRGYTQAELDIQYDQSALVPDLAPYIAQWTAATEAARQQLDCVLDIPYGPSAREKLDIYRPAAADCPVVVSVHGGAWRRLSKDQAAGGASPMVAAGAAYIVLGFDLADAVGLREMVRQVRAGVSWVFRHGEQYGIDPERIYLHGFSSGAHLAATVLADGWRKTEDLPEDLIKGAVLGSGPYDLEPVMLSARSGYLNLDPADAPSINPILHVPDQGPPEVFVWGEGEHTEFRRQSAGFAAAWKRAGNPCETAELAGLNHFDVCNAFADPDSVICAAARRQIGLD